MSLRQNHELLPASAYYYLKLPAQRNETETNQFWNCFISVSFRCADCLRQNRIICTYRATSADKTISSTVSNNEGPSSGAFSRHRSTTIMGGICSKIWFQDLDAMSNRVRWRRRGMMVFFACYFTVVIKVCQSSGLHLLQNSNEEVSR